MSVKPKFQTVLKTAAVKRDIFSETGDAIREQEATQQEETEADLQSIPTQSPLNPIADRAITRVENKPYGLLKRKRKNWEMNPRNKNRNYKPFSFVSEDLLSSLMRKQKRKERGEDEKNEARREEESLLLLFLRINRACLLGFYRD
jgi:hypothetical protein